jgi:hypothetical protein
VRRFRFTARQSRSAVQVGIAELSVLFVLALPSAGEADPDIAPAPPAVAATPSASVTAPVTRLDGPVAELIVRLSGPAAGVCTGTPIDGGRMVVTAGHCTVDRRGAVRLPTVTDAYGETYRVTGAYVRPGSVWIDGAAVAEHDAAVLVLDEPVRGASATLAGPGAGGPFTVAGMQPIDSRGELIRPGSLYDGYRPADVVGRVPAGCVLDTVEPRSSELGPTIRAACGTRRGSSGGPLLVPAADGGFAVAGVVSTANGDATWVTMTPSSVHAELIADPSAFVPATATAARPVAAAPVTRT